MINIINIHKEFNGNNIIKGISLNIREGEIITIYGRSGAGKSTLLNIIGSLLKPSNGKIIIDNTDIYKMKDKELSEFRNKNIGFIFQTPNLIEELNAYENIILPTLISKDYSQKYKNKAEHLLKEFEIYEHRNDKIKNLSGGEKQRLAIIRAMIMQPKIIIADEPTGNLDELNKKYLNEKIKMINKRYNETIIIATHDKDMAKISKHILIIKDGKINET